MSALELFASDDFSVRTVTIGGEPWFVAADVCRALDISNVSMALSRIDMDDLSSTEAIDSMGRMQVARTVNEAGLYELVLASRKPEARTFKRWITHDVIPAIRKTGSYVAAPAHELDPVLGLVEALGTIRREQLADRALLAETRAEAHASRHEAREAVELAQMAHAKIDRRHPDNPDLAPITVTTIGARLTPPVSGQQANQLLRAAGFQWRQNGQWTPTSDGRPFAVVEHGEHPETGFPFTQLKWQARIVSALERRIARRAALAHIDGGAA